MNNKGYSEGQVYIETSNDTSNAEKPLKSETITKNRVDINVLKSKLKEIENKEFRKNLIIFLTFAIALGTLGIYLSI